MFLSTKNLIELTDRKRAYDQIAWLSAHGFRFEISAAGRPKVLEDEVRKRLSSPIKSRASEPRLDLVK